MIPAQAPITPSASTSSSQYVTRSTTGSLSTVKKEVDGGSTSSEGLIGVEEDESKVDEVEEEDDAEAQIKLEQRREKNRVKQRNLRREPLPSSSVIVTLRSLLDPCSF